MRDERMGSMFTDDKSRPHKYGNITHSDPNLGSTSASDDEFPMRHSSASGGTDPGRISGEGSPMTMSPWNQTAFTKYEWSQPEDNLPQNALIGSLVREEGHIYSLAASGDLLYTGSDSKNIRVWKNLEEFSGFKSNSGLVKAIIVSGEKIFSGHQDGKIRVWKVSPKNPNVHKRVGSLPTLKDIFKSSIKPSNYVEVRRRRSSIWIKHSDAISSLSLTNDRVYLYSASWDRTVKVWRVANSKCVESIKAHDDAVNAVICCEEGLVYTGSADGTVKVWKREQQGKGTKHTPLQTLLKQECAVNALAWNAEGSVLYCGSSDGLVNFWEYKKQFSHGGVLKGHKLAVLCLATAGNAMVFTGSADKTICVWRRDGLVHTCLSVLTSHNGPVKCLAVEVEKDEQSSSKSDRRWIVYSGSLDKSVKVWSVSEMAVDPNQIGRMQQQQAAPGFGTDSFKSEKSVSSASGSRASENRRY